MFRDLSFDDAKDMLNMKGNAFDVLAAVAGRGKEILDDQAAVSGRGKEILDDHIAATETKRRLTRIHHDDDGEASTSTEPKKRKCNFPNIKINGQHPPPPLPEEFENEIQKMARGKNLTPPTLVIQKSLFSTDLSPGHNRLSIPMSQILRDDFLMDEEKCRVRGYDDLERKKKKYIKVKIIEPSLASDETVKFSRWDMEKKSNGGKTSSSYIINGNWNHIVKRNKLRVKMEVQLWCFRVDGDLCFALVRLPQNSSGFTS